MKKRFTEEQIIKVLEEVKMGLKVAEVCRKFGITVEFFDILLSLKEEDSLATS